MKLDTLRNNPGARKRRKRLGRGPGSGHGKTSCKGHKGQWARSGVSIRAGFEGGQMPLIRRIPKRGFRSPRRERERMETVNVEQLNIFDEGAVVDPQALAARGLIRNRNTGVKILGGGELTKRLEVLADAFSASSRKKIEDAKGVAKVREAGNVKSEEGSAKPEAASKPVGEQA
ncbi:MAG: 50S ribosomal protein L15 [Candidatus Aureabacteria bacterium]|nr:50S ribosomal protein L15 [Candidatus Auribacterota bacterium]